MNMSQTWGENKASRSICPEKASQTYHRIYLPYSSFTAAQYPATTEHFG
jgi:hypothetical protein